MAEPATRSRLAVWFRRQLAAATNCAEGRTEPLALLGAWLIYRSDVRALRRVSRVLRENRQRFEWFGPR